MFKIYFLTKEIANVRKCVRIITEKKNVGRVVDTGAHAEPRKIHPHRALHTAVVILGAVCVKVVKNSRATAVGVTVGVKNMEEH